MKRGLPAILCLMLLSALVRAGGFDYYTLSVTMTPAFCDLNPGKRGSTQCRERAPVSVHGLWPERVSGGRLEYCRGERFFVSSARERELRLAMPDKGLQRYQWEKHGRCSGLAADAYFGLLSREFNEVIWPASFRPQGRDVVVAREVLLTEFRRLNAAFPERGIVLRCEGKGRPPLLTEVRLCLSPEGQPGACRANYRPNCPAAVKIRAWR